MDASDHTLEGLKAKYRRARTLLDEARACPEATLRFDKLVSAIEPAVGIADQIERAARGPYREIRGIGKSELRRRLVGELPYLALLEKLRIQDFHYAGLTSAPGTTLARGAIRMRAQGPNASAVHSIGGPDQKPFTQTSPGACVTFDKNLVHQHEDKFFDEQSDEYVTLDHALAKFLERIPEMIEWYRNIRARTRS